MKVQHLKLFLLSNLLLMQNCCEISHCAVSISARPVEYLEQCLRLAINRAGGKYLGHSL